MSYHQDTLNALALLVELTRGNTPTEGRVRLQKTVYLAKVFGLHRLRNLKFCYHHYGPYSEQLAGALRSAVASGLINENAERFDDEWQKFSYRLNEAHPDANFLQLDKHELDFVRALKTATRPCHWRVLELSATALFLEHVRRMSRREAIDLALRHKPACKPHREESEQLLARLSESLSPATLQPHG